MAEDINVRIWRNMLKQGVDTSHVLNMAVNHEASLDSLPQSEERDQAIRETVAFIKEIQEREGL